MTGPAPTRAPRRVARWMSALLVVCLLPGCFSFTHQVNRGGQDTKDVRTATQWFALQGLVEFPATASGELAEGASDYTVRTHMTFMDVLISAIPSLLGFYRYTIEVERGP